MWEFEGKVDFVVVGIGDFKVFDWYYGCSVRGIFWVIFFCDSWENLYELFIVLRNEVIVGGLIFLKIIKIEK